MERIDTHVDASPWWGHRFNRGYLSFNVLVEMGSADVEVIDHEGLTGVRLTMNPYTHLLPTITNEVPRMRADDPGTPTSRSRLVATATTCVKHLPLASAF